MKGLCTMRGLKFKIEKIGNETKEKLRRKINYGKHVLNILIKFFGHESKMMLHPK